MGRFVDPGNSAFQDALSSKIYILIKWDRFHIRTV